MNAFLKKEVLFLFRHCGFIMCFRKPLQ
ncbi:hypothetical protein B4U80_01787 [Leptotrombidium deliense]|uniref:Uncharacterized protein n=1 Tax=Leptotrombidium deliense TaxID=299467 RepID=A0A443S4I4_9ACAR|nr:hypothetical protein B4U80_01787 [Leptotrombidium deliense]